MGLTGELTGADSIERDHTPIEGDYDTDSSAAPGSQDRVRFTRAVTVALGIVSLPYLGVLWDMWTGTVNPNRMVAPSNFFDLQGRAMLAGRLNVPKGSLGIEAFVHNGHDYTYFGVFPSLLRMPLLAVTNSFDGQLTAPSLLLAWMVTGLFASLLLWRLRVMLRGTVPLGRAEAVCYGVVVAALTGGSVLMFLAAAPKVMNEDVAWSVALTIGALFALLGVAEHPTRRRVAAAGALILMAALDRGPTGYACVLGAVLIAGWFALAKGEHDNRRWAVPMLLVGLASLAINALFSWLKLGQAFGLSEANQVWTHVSAHRRHYLAANGGSAFGLRFLPSTLTAYLRPNGINLSAAFPYVTLPTTPAATVGNVVLDQTYPTASISASMPLIFLLACWGVITAFRPKPLRWMKELRLFLVAAAAGTAGILLFGYIADRYLSDFLPFLALAAMIGIVDLWRRLDGRTRVVRIVAVGCIGTLGAFGVWANIGAAVAPTSLWTPTQASNFVSTQRSLGGTGPVLRGDTLPNYAPAGTLAVVGQCTGLYLSTGFSYAAVPGQQLQHLTWLPVEQGPGINHVLRLRFNRPVVASDLPIPLMTYRASTLVLVPTGKGHVRMQVEGAGAARVTWPPTSTDPVAITPLKTYRITIMTDPNMHSIQVAGLGSGIQHYLAGSGPAVLLTSASSQQNDGRAEIVVLHPSPGSLALCRTIAGLPKG